MTALVLLCAGCLAASPAEPNPSDSDRAAYEAARAQAGRSPDAQVRLAYWCEQHGLAAERLKHLALAVLSDPSHATARGLLGLVAYRGQWKRPEAVSDQVKADAALAAALAEYNARRAKAGPSAEAQWKLGLWCEQKGLGPEARAHFAAVTRLDPSREAAWKRLGFKKVEGRWVTDAQLAAEKAEAEAQKQGDRRWKPLLTKWRGWLGDKDKSRRAEAEEALAGVTDPSAVPAVWSVFAAGTPAQQEVAVRLFGQIDAPQSSRALAVLSVFSDSAEARRAATETLRRRDPREFAGLLVALLRDPIKYEVRPVGGPGSPGALFVEGKRFNVQRLYAPPAMPNLPILPNDPVTLDFDGLPVVGHMPMTYTAVRNTSLNKELRYQQFLQYNPTDATVERAVQDFRAHYDYHAYYATLLEIRRLKHYSTSLNPLLLGSHLTIDVTRPQVSSTPMKSETIIPVGRLMLEYQKAAVAAQGQLASDAALIDAVNDGITDLNRRVAQVLDVVAGQDLGTDPKRWQEWWVNTKGYAYTTPPDEPVPTVVEDVPLAYVPQAVPICSISSPIGPTATITGPVSFSAQLHIGGSCFGAGTPVRTLLGVRPIEALQVGDRVLTQDIRTGALQYQPVLVVHHNPPTPTFLVRLGGETIVSSPFHRFWKPGRGWVMARDLKAGDTLRLLDGPARVESVESGKVQPVFNLDVAEDHDFFAGACGALVHDNTLPDPRLVPFDAPPSLAAVARGGE